MTSQKFCLTFESSGCSNEVDSSMLPHKPLDGRNGEDDVGGVEIEKLHITCYDHHQSADRKHTCNFGKPKEVPMESKRPVSYGENDFV